MQNDKAENANALQQMRKTQAAYAVATVNPAFSENVRAIYGRMLAEVTAEIATFQARNKA